MKWKKKKKKIFSWVLRANNEEMKTFRCSSKTVREHSIESFFDDRYLIVRKRFEWIASPFLSINDRKKNDLKILVLLTIPVHFKSILIEAENIDFWRFRCRKRKTLRKCLLYFLVLLIDLPVGHRACATLWNWFVTISIRKQSIERVSKTTHFN